MASSLVYIARLPEVRLRARRPIAREVIRFASNDAHRHAQWRQSSRDRQVRETQGDAATTLKKRHKIEGRDDVLKTMAGALDAFVSAAAN